MPLAQELGPPDMPFLRFNGLSVRAERAVDSLFNGLNVT